MCASSTSLVAVCDVIRDAGTFDFACHLILDERDRLVERRPARTGVTHRDVLEPDRHATEEDEPVRGDTISATVLRYTEHAICRQLCSPSARSSSMTDCRYMPTSAHWGGPRSRSM